MLTLIAVSLALIVLLLALIAWKVLSAFKNLSEERLKIYVTLSGEVNDWVGRSRRNQPVGNVRTNASRQFDVIASYLAVAAFNQVLEGLATYKEKISSSAPPGEIAAAEQRMEAALIKLNVAMRDDLHLNTGSGRFPNAEVFRRKRGEL